MVLAANTGDVLGRILGSRMLEDLHVGDESMPWIPYPGAEGVSVKLLQIDLRNNRVVNVTRFEKAEVIGTHRHNGEVLSYTFSGSWRYLEYDWSATAGSFVYEAPGRVHTLAVEEPTVEALFVMTGTFDYLLPDGTVAGSQDAFWTLDFYIDHCGQAGLPVNERIIV